MHHLEVFPVLSTQHLEPPENVDTMIAPAPAQYVSDLLGNVLAHLWVSRNVSAGSPSKSLNAGALVPRGIDTPTLMRRDMPRLIRTHSCSRLRL
jgi:hypothetical protein